MTNKKKEKNPLELAIIGIQISLLGISISLIASVLPDLIGKYPFWIKTSAQSIILAMAFLLLYISYKIYTKQIYKK